MNTQLWLCLALAFTGLWSGLLLTVTTLLHPIFADRDLPGFRADLGRFLPIARRSPTNYVLVLGLVLTPAVAVAALWDTRSSAPFVLTVIALVLAVTGAIGVSRFLAEPNYDEIVGWDTAEPEDRLRAARHRYFALNWLRGALVWTAFGCLLAATYLEWT